MRLVSLISFVACLSACSSSGESGSSSVDGGPHCGLTASSDLSLTGTKTGGDAVCSNTITIAGTAGDSGTCALIPSADGCEATIDCNSSMNGAVAALTGSIHASGNLVSGSVTVSASGAGTSFQCTYSLAGAFK